MTASTALATTQGHDLAETSGDILSSPAAYAHAWALAQTLAKSQLLPTVFRNKPEDVLMSMLLAQRMGEDVFTVLANVHFVNGKPGWGAPFLIARANASGLFTGPLEFDVTGEGKGLAATCSAVSRATGKRLSKTVSMEMARADGWLKNAKYNSIPEQMLSYRAAVFFIRLHCPGILYGFRPADELEDIAAAKGQRIETSYEEPAPLASPSPIRPPLALADASAPPVALDSRVPTSATSTSTAAPRGAGGDSSPAGSTPVTASPSVSSPSSSPGEVSSGSSAPAGGDGTQAPKRITRAKLARQRAVALRKAETAEQKAERQKGHHPSWKDGYKTFAVDLAALGVPEADIDTVSAWCDYRSVGRPRPVYHPSQRSPQERQELLDRLASEGGRSAFLGWADELVDAEDREAQPAEEGEAQAVEEDASLTPQVFASAEVALAWGMDKGAFATIEQAREAYDNVKREGQPGNAHEMAAMWVAEVQGCAAARLAEQSVLHGG